MTIASGTGSATASGTGSVSGARPLAGEEAAYERIYRNPKFQELVSRRSSFGWTLAIIMLVIYYGFILLVAFGKGFLATRIGAGVMTIGIPIAFGVIVIAFILTAIYVSKANSDFDQLSNELQREVTR